MMKNTSCVRVAALAGALVLGACGEYKSGEGESPLEDLATRLPEAASLSSGIAVGSSLSSGGSLTREVIQEQADLIEMGRDVYCLFKAALDGSTVSLRAATVGGPYVGATAKPALVIERTIAVGTGGLNCIAITRPLTMRTALVAWDGTGAVMPLPWSRGQRIESVHVIVQLTADGNFDSDADIDDHVVFALTSGLGADIDVFPDAQTTPAEITAGFYTAQIKPQRLQDVLGASVTVPTTINLQVDLATAGQRKFLGALTWAGSQVDRPVVVDVRTDSGGGTGAVIKTDSSTGSTLELFGPFFVDTAGPGQRSGFALDGQTPTQLLEAFDVSGSVTHTSSNQGSYTLPTDFRGWPGDSTVWTTPLGHGRSTEFTSVLGGLPAVTSWFGS